MEQSQQSQNKQGKRGYWKLWAVIAVCAAPMIASYFTYYVIKPGASTNYGSLLDPRMHPIPDLATVTLEDKPQPLSAYKGKWILLTVDASQCGDYCRKKLHDMRQLRLAQGKEMDRVERAWLITDKEPLETWLLREYDGTRMLRVSADKLRKWLPTEPGAVPSDYIYMIDPLGNLMMRFPKNADANRVKRDITRLLKASRIG